MKLYEEQWALKEDSEQRIKHKDGMSMWEEWNIYIYIYISFNSVPRHEGVLGKWRYSSTHSLISALDGREWSASRPGRFTPRERVPGTHGIGGWVGPRAVLVGVVKRKIPSLCREYNLELYIYIYIYSE
jgi:hypothetical protein